MSHDNNTKTAKNERRTVLVLPVFSDSLVVLVIVDMNRFFFLFLPFAQMSSFAPV